MKGDGVKTGTNLLSSTVFNNGSSDVLTVSRSYDSLTRLESISSSAASAPLREFSYIYNDRDQRTRCTLADGSYWVYAYDNLGQVTSGIKYDDDDQPIPGCTFGYAFDDIGNRKTATSDLTGTATYDPNTLNQYESRTVPGIIPVIGTAAADTVVKIHRKSLGNGPAAFIVPDRTGDIFHKNIPVNNANGPVTEELDVYCHKHLTGPPAQEIAAKASRTVTVPKSPETFTHDPDGNLTSDGIWIYTWDAENRLVSAERGTGILPVKLDFAYDYMSRRTSKKVYSWDGSAWQLDKTEKFVYDGWNLVATFNAANELQRSFCWAGLGDLVADTDHIAGKSYLPIYDGNKNIHGYVDAADGSLVSEYDFDPFGRIVAQSGTGDFPFRFASYFRDEETGMVYYGYRYYSPEMGRWLGRDPIGEAGGLNILAMAANNPISLWDILGLDTQLLNWLVRDRNPDMQYRTACWKPQNTAGIKNPFMELAKHLGLDPGEWKKWVYIIDTDGSLRPMDELDLSSSGFPFHETQVAVPNIFAIWHITGLERITKSLVAEATNAGYNVVEGNINDIPNKHFIIGAALLGHFVAERSPWLGEARHPEFVGGFYMLNPGRFTGADKNTVLTAHGLRTLLGKRDLRGVALVGCNSYKGNWTSVVTRQEKRRAWVTYYKLWDAFDRQETSVLPYEKDVGDVINSHEGTLGAWFDEIFGN